MTEHDFKTSLRVAVVGLGQMGAGIARNLDLAGLLFGAFDVRKDVFASVGLSDSVSNASIEKLRQAADVVLFAVPTTADVRAALADSEGRPGQIVIDVSTSDPEESRALSKSLAEQGQHFVDAAMTGGAVGADTGKLTLMVGGEADVLARCRPVFDAISAKVFHLGPAGAGHAMKLVHNMILHSNFLATCEGLQMAKRAGLDEDLAVEVLNAGNARSFVTEVRFPRDILSGTMLARSQVANLEKDLGLAVEFAEELDARAPFGGLTRKILSLAIEGGYENVDFSHLYPLYEGLAEQVERSK